MSDLISRKAVMDYLREQQASVIIEQNKENYVTYDATKGMLASIDAFMNFIVQLPTAYDVDKVVEQLNEAEYDHGDGWCMDLAIDTETAIKIVKGGGRDE